MVVQSLLRSINFSLCVCEAGHSSLYCFSKESPEQYQVPSYLGQPGKQRICFPQHWKLYTYLYFLLCLVPFQLLVCQSKPQLFGNGYTYRLGFIPAPEITMLSWLCVDNFVLSALNLGWLVPCPGVTCSDWW